MADDEQKMTVRERRAQNAKSNAIKTAPGKIARKAIVPAIVVLVIAAIATGMYFNDKNAAKCPTHWHATFDVYVQDGNGTAQRLSFAAPQFDLNGQTPLRAHMHQSDRKNQWHFEQGGLCVGVEEALSYIDVNLSPGSVKVEGPVHEAMGQSGTYKADGTHKLVAYVEHVSDRQYEERGAGKVIVSETLEWREQSISSILDYQLKDGERVLILHGDYTPEQVEQFKAAMAVPDTGRPVG
jgi:hypothetical protein